MKNYYFQILGRSKENPTFKETIKLEGNIFAINIQEAVPRIDKIMESIKPNFDDDTEFVNNKIICVDCDIITPNS